jgi:flagellum-specific peptidoglycan hydrolase FlgJ
MTLEQSKKLSPVDFATLLYPYARKCEARTGISALAILTQAAWESGWNSASPGWMFFGVKDTDGVNGNEQLLTTTEYSRRPDEKFPVVISVTPTTYGGRPGFKYKIKDYFRKYDSPEESFVDHANFFLRNPRYAKAMAVKNDPNKFFDEIAAAGYATDPNYAANLKAIATRMAKLVNV